MGFIPEFNRAVREAFYNRPVERVMHGSCGWGCDYE